MTLQLSRDAVGARCFRSSVALAVADQSAADDLQIVLGRFAAAGRFARLMTVGDICRHAGWVELELHVRSSEVDDDHDVGAVNELQLVGDRASGYWTRAAATLVDATILVAEIIQEAVIAGASEPSNEALAMWTVPRGSGSRRADPSVLPPPPSGVAVIQLDGIPTAHGARLAAAMRDEMDDHRWGPTARELPTVRYDRQRKTTIVTYPPLDGDRRVSLLLEVLGDTAAALEHLKSVLDRVGAVASSGIETCLRPMAVPVRAKRA